MEMNQYSIILVNLDPTVGSEIQKTRPCVVISPNEMNRHLNTLIIAPMTSNTNVYPTRVSVSHNGKKGSIVVDQIRTIDKSRVLKTLGILTFPEIKALKIVIKNTLVD
ncbi:type II toxin-antitoxin system PemK/MazF family toxin [Aquiflexum sp. LQ15W]|uniref:type II toxin-antitoxin system PemK/MazF family toxin n=1 Tax=Cognataquiflexum nitidum TaxID=2922272 RepID=UPI001F135C46|nr:type II toxin-antitoxin system PemK/MazF family toxin [Cognataquiflexum nitidum]MCH6198359.1 type II toxin-antitoxin system PemK/MazF family toxin [Cognataquiflexum nitidum]